LKLTKRQHDLVEFCKGGKTTLEVCDQFEVSPTTALKYLVHLRECKLIDKIKTQRTQIGASYCLYVAVGSEPNLNRCLKKINPNSKTMEKSESFINKALIRAAHNPFNLH
jgi:predicted transcriptional regulator